MVHTLTKSLRPNAACCKGISSSDMMSIERWKEKYERERKTIAFKKKMCFSFVYRSGIDIVQAIIVITWMRSISTNISFAAHKKAPPEKKKTCLPITLFRSIWMLYIRSTSNDVLVVVFFFFFCFLILIPSKT